LSASTASPKAVSARPMRTPPGTWRTPISSASSWT
jgi:hypothetical protein